MVVSGRKQSTLKEIITDVKNSICIETLHSVCTTGAKKDNAQKVHQISYCPEKRIKPEAVEVAGQENQVRWRAEQSPQLPSRNTDIRDLEIPLPKTLNSLQPPKQEILNTYLGYLRLKKSLNERDAALLATLPAETTLLFSRKGERDLEICSELETFILAPSWVGRNQESQLPWSQYSWPVQLQTFNAKTHRVVIQK